MFKMQTCIATHQEQMKLNIIIVLLETTIAWFKILSILYSCKYISCVEPEYVKSRSSTGASYYDALLWYRILDRRQQTNILVKTGLLCIGVKIFR